jgi:hypothetical protein
VPVPRVDQIELRYRLTDVTVRSTPSTAGRALAAIGPLTGSTGDDLPVRFIVSGDGVRGLSCPLLPLAQRSCGFHVQGEPGWQAELPARLGVVTVQLDLPPA